HSDLGIIQGKHNDRGRRITIASIDTLSELHRLRQYYQSLSEPLRAIFIDEAQGSVSLSVSRVLDTLDPNHTAARLGDSATLFRADRKSLATVFPDGLVYTKDFRSLILEGYLADIEAYDVETNLVITREQIVALQQQAERAEQEGTINHPSDAALIKLLKDSNGFQQAYRSWMDITEGVLKTMIFAQSVQDAYAFRDYWRAQGATAEGVSGRMSDSARNAILKRFEPGGDLQAIVNYDVFATGANIPHLACIIIARVMHLAKCIQCVGRGLRLWLDKIRCILINLTDQHHTLMSMEMFLGRTIPPESSIRRILAETVAKEEGMQVETLLSLAPHQVRQMFQQSQIRAIDVFAGDGWQVDSLTGEATKGYGNLGKLETVFFSY